MSRLTIVTYHYVRDLARTRYPSIKARDLAAFRRQLDYIGRNFTVVTAEAVLAALSLKEDLPSNACWLTFDDGYLDHFTNVLPLLHDRKWQGTFFPAARAVMRQDVLDVNKIQFVLAAANTTEILAYIRGRIEASGADPNLQRWSEYETAYAHQTRFDSADVTLVKRLLQAVLPGALRARIVDELFSRFVSIDERAFGAELYMSMDQVRMLNACGMHVGSHGYDHVWLDTLDAAGQKRDIDLSLEFLDQVAAKRQKWIMCYPYGRYNDSLLEVLRGRQAAIGLTTHLGEADLARDSHLTLPRLDTNDLPAD